MMKPLPALEQLVRQYIDSSSQRDCFRRPLSIGIVCEEMQSVSQLLSSSNIDRPIQHHILDLSSVHSPQELFEDFAKAVISAGSDTNLLFTIGDFAINELAWVKYFLAIMEDGHVSSKPPIRLPPSVLFFTTTNAELLSFRKEEYWNEEYFSRRMKLAQNKFFDFSSRLSMFFDFKIAHSSS